MRVPCVSVRGVTDAVGAVFCVEENCCVDETMGRLVGCRRCGCVCCDKLILGHDGVECRGHCVVLLPPNVRMRGSVVFVFEILAYAVWIRVDTKLHVVFPRFLFEE